MTCVEATRSCTSSAISAGLMRRAEGEASFRLGDLIEVAAIGACAWPGCVVSWSRILAKNKRYRGASRNHCPQCRASGMRSHRSEGEYRRRQEGCQMQKTETSIQPRLTFGYILPPFVQYSA